MAVASRTVPLSGLVPQKSGIQLPSRNPKFFNQYKRCMGLVPDSLWIPGDRFFNYCKLVISKEDSVLREEINAAEGNTRFLVGTYRALRLSLWVFVTLLVFQLIAMALLHIRGIPITDLVRSHLASLALSTLLLIAGSRAAQIHIKRQFRGIRLWEAYNVYDASIWFARRRVMMPSHLATQKSPEQRSRRTDDDRTAQPFDRPLW